MDGEFPLWIQCSIVGDSCYKIFHEILKTAFQHALDILSYLPCWQIVMLWKILLMPNLYFCICLEISTVFIMSKSLPSSFFFFSRQTYSSPFPWSVSSSFSADGLSKEIQFILVEYTWAEMYTMRRGLLHLF